jgi:hypothetical protein
MKITKHLEIHGYRFEATIESKSLITHSAMQSLTEKDIEDYQFLLNEVLESLFNALPISPNELDK